MKSNGYTERVPPFMTTLTRFVLLVFVIVSPAARAHADLPPQEYARLRSAATIVAVIEVEQVRRGFGLFREFVPVTVTAVVTDVVVGAERLRTGDSVVITYHHQRPRRGWVGPRPIPLLQPGQYYTAYLRPSGDGSGTYQPAARGASFE